MVCNASLGARLQIASDLHLECRLSLSISQLLHHTTASALILAGDIGPVAYVAKVFESWPVPVIYVLGNHDYGSATKELRKRPRGEIWLNSNVLLLEDGVVYDGRNRFAGCCLWTDYDLFGRQEHAMELARDYAAGNGSPFRPTPEMKLDWHRRSVAWLTDLLSTPVSGRTVVISHHAPHPRSLVSYRHHNNYDAAFASNLSPLLKEADVWVHGHIHHSSNYAIKDCRVMCNPLGAVRINSAFNPEMLVELS
jgi:predicted phosphodiesterase